MPPTNPKRRPPMVTTRPSGWHTPGRANSGQSAASSTLPGMAYVGVVIAANSAAYCSRTASSTTAAGSGKRDHASRMKARISPGLPEARSCPNRALTSTPNTRPRMPRAGST